MSIYTYINEDQIDLELKCIICNKPLQLPVNCTKCGQTICQKCFNLCRKQQLSCPFCRQDGSQFVPVITRIVFNQLNHLLVQCSLCQQTNIRRGNFADHIAYTCVKQIVPCTNKCGWKGRRENLENHLIRCRQTSHWWKILRRWSPIACFMPNHSN
ncbi:unnamed protein product [Rotaria sp. Silwood1]|nr:unnamed protein product [Rotaria sp. Silwood1]CAF3559582.1 unnamed protein product [Rotaria sp. Silwood1]CAF3586342.1 unnamed protein product [Rotaria sp. Silwood1]CAF3616201.1 unnamed protein product [Rotaria sp. Silwood1]CAF4544422.1 unnamed protein product [Rotaria sp. Silwood1]